MNNLINIKNEDGKQLLSAKELYLGLGLNKAVWSRWSLNNIVGNDFFKENVDWIGVQHDVEGNETMDFAISIDFAKHIAMMARTEKSHEYRNYFIECEKQVQSKLPTNFKEALLQLVQAEEEKEKLSIELTEKSKFINQIAVSQNSLLVREVAKIASKSNIVIGEKRLWAKLREWGLIFKHTTEPMQEYVNRGYFEVTEGARESSTGTFTFHTTRVTGKGQEYVVNRLIKEGQARRN